MNKTYYIAVFMEMTPSGAEFHTVTADNKEEFHQKFNETPGEAIVNRSKTVHMMGDITVQQAPAVDAALIHKSVQDAIDEIQKHRGTYMSKSEAERIFKHLRIARSEAQK